MSGTILQTYRNEFVLQTTRYVVYSTSNCFWLDSARPPLPPAAIPKNIAQIRKQTEALQLRVDTNESIFVQKAIAIKGLRIAIEEKDSEIRSLKRKVRWCAMLNKTFFF